MCALLVYLPTSNFTKVSKAEIPHVCCKTAHDSHKTTLQTNVIYENENVLRIHTRKAPN